MAEQFLYQKMDTRREDGIIEPIPDYLPKNLNPGFEMRPYQNEALENFIWYFESKNCPHPTQVLFYMATGSGKTLIMAELIIYLYKKGYRDFLFFVNLSNIVEKTRENFMNETSTKYLFAPEIIIDGEHICIRSVDNFQDSDPDAINICFTTTQGLHMDMRNTKEGAMTPEDFDERKVVFISDEAHHLNVDTKKKMSQEEEESFHSWEETVNNLFHRDRGNVLLEFTATCDLDNQAIYNAYLDKIIYSYDLSKYYRDKYSKEIYTLSSDIPVMDRALQALILSQYRLKVFQSNKLTVKPVVLFKAAKIKESKKFMKDFLYTVEHLTGDRLRELSEKADAEIMQRAYQYFADHQISFDTLAAELRDDFSEEHCLSVNDDKDVEQRQILLNTLEDESNPYRAIFEVKKLDEGWDVLNLFDIVRLYDTRQSGKGKLAPATIAEAQLIGRGARYCPFQLDDEQPKYQRKYDDDADNEMRVCETLYYHCMNDSRYVYELHQALISIGLGSENMVQQKYILKEDFKKDDLYKEGIVFVNDRNIKNRKDIYKLPDKIIDSVYSYRESTGESVVSEVMEEDMVISRNNPGLITTHMTISGIAEINYAIVNKALMKYPIFKFDHLKTYFPNLKSTREFVMSDAYLGNIRIDIQSLEEGPSVQTMYNAVFYVLGQIGNEISNIGETYQGSKEFRAEYVRDVFHDKLVNYTDPHDGGIGVSQDDRSVNPKWRIDLKQEDWFAYTDNFGTSEEKAFIAYFKGYVDELKQKYDKIYLIRNERELHLYSFDDGDRFEPDYVLFLQEEKGKGFEQMQIFIEPKGDMLMEKDAWKEKFLLQLRENAIPVKTFADDNNYKIWGVHFFNQSYRLKEFNEDMQKI